LKVPVQHVISYMRIIREREGDTLSNTSKDLTIQAEKGAERVTRLIDDLLSYCRLDNKLGETVTVDCKDLLNGLKEELYNSFGDKEIKIDILTAMPRIQKVHHSMIYRVFLNLVGNGLKFNKSEIPKVTISCSQEDNKHIFCIKDNGIGLNAGGKPMFQMFRRLHTESEFQGTGIGLATCKKIVNYYKGEIWYESSAKDTTFFFTLPVF
jgi:light-regulated signal transduction histidine kinase (bacteriophytochrome)